VDGIGSIDFEAIVGIKDEAVSSTMYHHILNTIGHDHEATDACHRSPVPG
jgi:hypothetical protein